MNDEIKAPEEQVVTVTNEEVTNVVTDDSDGAGHKVLFFVIMGIVCLSGIGIPVAMIIIWKQRKKLKQYEQQFGALPKEEKKQDAAAPTEENKSDSKAETESK